MHLVEATQEDSGDLIRSCSGAALVVLFASGDELRNLQSVGSGVLPLAPEYSISSEDAYLVLPEDIGSEIVDILRDGDADLLADAMAEGLLVVGCIRHRREHGPELLAQMCMTPADALAANMPYAHQLRIGGSGGGDALQRINSLPHLQCTSLSALLDDDGLEAVLGKSSHVGCSWQVAPDMRRLGDVEATHVWSRHLGPGRVGIELAIFAEEDELIALMRPLELRGV